jgi:hypothetical protein
LVDITDFNSEVLDIYSKDVLNMIRDGITGWEDKVPAYVDTIIKENHLFGYDPATGPNPDHYKSTKDEEQKVNPF